MTACGSLRSLFENPLPDNPTLIESLSSWNHHKPMKPLEVSSFAEIFGELYFHEKPESHANNPPVPKKLDQGLQSKTSENDSKNVQAKPPLAPPLDLPKNRYLKCNEGFSAKKSESLQLCTEGLGSESSDDVDDMLESGDDWRSCGNGKVEIRRPGLMYCGFSGYARGWWDVKPSKSGREFPPPISSIGKSGKPCVCLKSYREDGRFVLKEIRIPSQELLHASREDGRLKLHFVHHDDDIVEGGEEDEEEENQEIVNGEEQEVDGGEGEEEEEEKKDY